jgi:hypothetical protein
MATLPVLTEPLSAGLTTIPAWAGKIGRSPDYVAYFWPRMDGWPGPVGRLPGRGRRGGGKGLPVYREAELDAFRDANPATCLERTRRRVAGEGLDRERQVTWSEFATIAGVANKTVYQYRGKPGTLIDWWNGRPGRRRSRAQAAQAA